MIRIMRKFSLNQMQSVGTSCHNTILAIDSVDVT